MLLARLEVIFKMITGSGQRCGVVGPDLQNALVSFVAYKAY